jgi:hypothetical protein
MAKPLLYSNGEEIRKGDCVRLQGEAGEIDLVLDGETNPEAWPAQEYGRGIMISERKVFGHLFLAEADIAVSGDLVFVSRSR